MRNLAGLIAIAFLAGCVSYCPIDTPEVPGYPSSRPARLPELPISEVVLDSIAARLTLPLDRIKVTSGYGLRRKKFHEGIDLAGKLGSPVYAAHDGTVGIDGMQFYGFGKLVVLRSTGQDFISLYGHLNAVYVRPGQRVTAGELIGEVGATGDATGPHLHFEIRTKPMGAPYHQSVDPQILLSKITKVHRSNLS